MLIYSLGLCQFRVRLCVITWWGGETFKNSNSCNGHPWFGERFIDGLIAA